MNKEISVLGVEKNKGGKGETFFFSKLCECFASALCMQSKDSVRRWSLITANTHSEKQQRARGVIDLSLTYFASQRWNSRFWQDSTEQFTARLRELWVCFYKAERGR